MNIQDEIAEVTLRTAQLKELAVKEYLLVPNDLVLLTGLSLSTIVRNLKEVPIKGALRMGGRTVVTRNGADMWVMDVDSFHTGKQQLSPVSVNPVGNFGGV